MNGTVFLNDHVYSPVETAYDFIHNPGGILVLVIVGLVVTFLAAGAIIQVIRKKRKNREKDGEKD